MGLHRIGELLENGCSTAEFNEALNWQRIFACELGEILEAVAPEPNSPWYPLKDDTFWATLDRIQAAGDTANETEAAFLTDLILIDELGPMMRALLLSVPALLAVTFIPSAVQQEIVKNAQNLDYLTARNRKKGMLKLIEAADFRFAPEPLLRLLNDPDDLIQCRARCCMRKLLPAHLMRTKRR